MAKTKTRTKRSKSKSKSMKKLDVRSLKDIPLLEALLKKGPIVILVHWDQCGHCQRFDEKVWSKVPNLSTNPMKMVGIHKDMLEKTSLANAKIDGYPSLLLADKNGELANFKKENGEETNAMPQPSTAEDLEKIVKTDVNNGNNNSNNSNSNNNSNSSSNRNNNTNNNSNSNSNVGNANELSNNTNNNSKSNSNVGNANELNNNANNNTNTNNVNSLSTASNVLSMNNNSNNSASSNNSYKPAKMNNETIDTSAGQPPSILDDLVQSQQQNRKQMGGNLYRSLLNIVRQTKKRSHKRKSH